MRFVEYSRLEDMNDSLVNNWNDVVGVDDTVYVLGDVAMGKIAETLPIVSRMNGTKFLIPGNHDRCWFGGKKDHAKWVEKYEAVGFTILGNSVDDGCGQVSLSHLFEDLTWINGVDACHFPFTGDSHDADRYSAYRPVDRGQYLLHGHTHSSNVRSVNSRGEITREIHVGVDSWKYRPVSIEQIKMIMSADLLAYNVV